MRTQLQLLLSSIALTILIWTYADQSGHVSYTTVALVHYTTPADPEHPIVLRSRNPKAESPDSVRTEITVRGPRSAIRKLEKDDLGGKFQLSIVIGEALKPGSDVTRNLFTDLLRHPEIRNRGVVLQRVEPSEATFDVDVYKSIPLSVEVVSGSFEKVLAGSPVVNPAKVTARVLESEVSRLGNAPALRLPIEDELQSRMDQAGNIKTLSFYVTPKSPWPGLNVTFDPERVLVTVQIERTTRSERITLIPLGVLVEPQDFFEKYTIQWQDETGGHFTQAINARVPIEKIGQLKGNMIDAYVTIQDSDLPKELPGLPTSAPAPNTNEGWIEREVRFVFPPGFEDVKVEGQPRTVKFRIRPRDNAASKSGITPPAKAQ